MPRISSRPPPPPPPPSKKGGDGGKKKKRDEEEDSDVDSHGNIRDLIAYSSDEEKPQKGKGKGKAKPSHAKQEKQEKQEKPKSKPSDGPLFRTSPPKGPRKAKVAAQKKIQEEEAARRKAKKKGYVTSSSEDEDDETYTEEEDEEDEEDGETLGSQDTDTEDEEEEDEDDFTEDDDDDEDDSDGDADDEESEEDGFPLKSKKSPRLGGIELLISDFGGGDAGPPKPRKYKLKQEPENVRRFVKLVQTEVDPTEEDIDRDITYFKGLPPPAQDRLLTKLQQKIEPLDAPVPLRFQILTKDVDPEVERLAMAKYMALQSIDPSTTEYYKIQQWIHGYTELPLGAYKDLPVKIEDGAEACGRFVTSVREHMDAAIYGHDEAKLQILQFVSSWIANPKAAGNVLSLHGPPGTGKTTLVKDGIAKALGRPFHFISLGGATDSSYLDGHSYTYEGSTWGRIVDILIKSKCMNPVIYFDELDKVSETPKGEEIMNYLIHLTDQSQNDRIQDKYFAGINLDMSRCLFIFSHNNHEKVNPILRDRMYNVEIHGFDTKQKLAIAEQYLLPAALREVNLFEKVAINKEILTHVIENYTGEEKGVRELKRCIQTIISKLNLLRFYNDPKRVPFAITGFGLPFTVKQDHVKLLLNKKPGLSDSIQHLYL
jgi:flagellar biosynthesis GTPase FlhF